MSKAATSEPEPILNVKVPIVDEGVTNIYAIEFALVELERKINQLIAGGSTGNLTKIRTVATIGTDGFLNISCTSEAPAADASIEEKTPDFNAVAGSIFNYVKQALKEILDINCESEWQPIETEAITESMIAAHLQANRKEIEKNLDPEDRPGFFDLIWKSNRVRYRTCLLEIARQDLEKKANDDRNLAAQDQFSGIGNNITTDLDLDNKLLAPYRRKEREEKDRNTYRPCLELALPYVSINQAHFSFRVGPKDTPINTEGGMEEGRCQHVVVSCQKEGEISRVKVLVSEAGKELSTIDADAINLKADQSGNPLVNFQERLQCLKILLPDIIFSFRVDDGTSQPIFVVAVADESLNRIFARKVSLNGAYISKQANPEAE